MRAGAGRAWDEVAAGSGATAPSPAAARCTVRSDERSVRAAESRQHRPVKRGRWHPVVEARRDWHRLPLRNRLVLITTGLLTLGLLSASVAVTSLLQSHLMRQIDDQLNTTAQAISNSQLLAGTDTSMPSTYYLLVQYQSGEKASRISVDTRAKYGVPQVREVTVAQAIRQLRTSELTTVASSRPGSLWRVKTLPLKSTATGNYLGTVTIALPLYDAMETVERTRVVVALSDLAVILVGAIAATYLVRRSFRPLRKIEGVAGRIASGDLAARVIQTEPPTTEVGSLQRSVNAMLQRNEQAFDNQIETQHRMTRFVSDASHELRTPLSAIRGYGELYRMGGVPADRVDEVMGRIEDEASRMGRLVEDLLQLARMDEGRKMQMEAVDLTRIAAGALTDMMVLAPDRDCSLLPLDAAAAARGEEAASVAVIGDRDRLSQVLTNLLGNVVRHTPDGSPVEVAVGSLSATPSSKARAVVEVRDHGPGVPAKDAEKVFERFYRADTSRNRETGGSGLGLSIVAAIMAAHGGSARMVETPGGGATVRLELPLAPATARGPEGTH